MKLHPKTLNRIERVRERVGLGRCHAPDPRDKEHRMASVLRKPDNAKQRSSMMWPLTTGPLDQGSRPECVAYAWLQFLQAAPMTHVRDSLGDLDRLADLTYHRMQQVDEWDGENYDGTSVRAGAKVWQEKGRIAEYVWAWDAKTVQDFILQRGPVVVGTNWYERMFAPDADGYLIPEGELAGGHAWLVIGYSLRRNAFRMVNSWGRGWGSRGRAWVGFEVMDRLVKEEGEACSAIEVRPPASSTA